MQILWKLLLLVSLQSLSISALAQQVRVDSVDYRSQSAVAQLIFGVSSSAKRKVFLLDNPSRLVIDFKNTRLTKRFAQPPKNHAFFKRIRSAERNRNDLRVVVDLKKSVTQRSFIVPPNKQVGYRLVVDLAARGQQNNYAQAAKKPYIAKVRPVARKRIESRPKRTEPKVITKKSSHQKRREIVVAIDAGHGGIDSGAKGKHGTQEKRVVLAISKKLAKLINSQRGMRAVLVRKGDEYIKLRRRMEIAREANADLFISIHADAFKNRKVRGASVYTLSNNGASSEAARWLADSENAADLVGGVSLDDKDDILASVILDLSQSATKEASRNVAAKVLKNFKSVGRLHKHSVQKAAFAVLKSPDIPSILVETAFISNPYEEKNLGSRVHQQKIAQAVFKGVVNYFREYSPTDMRVASFEK